MIQSDHLILTSSVQEHIAKYNFYFSHIACSLLCFYYTRFSKKSLSDYCAKRQHIFEIFHAFLILITDYCDSFLCASSAPDFIPNFFVQFSAIFRIFSKKLLFIHSVIKKRPTFFHKISFRFVFHRKNPIVPVLFSVSIRLIYSILYDFCVKTSK